MFDVVSYSVDPLSKKKVRYAEFFFFLKISANKSLQGLSYVTNKETLHSEKLKGGGKSHAILTSRHTGVAWGRGDSGCGRGGVDLLAFLFKPLIKERRKNRWFPIKINLVFIFFFFFFRDSNNQMFESISVVPVVHHKRQCCAKKSCRVWSSEGGDCHRCDVISSLLPALWLTEQRSVITCLVGCRETS